MRKRLLRLTSTGTFAFCIAAFCISAPSSIREAGAVPPPETTVPVGEFKITASTTKDSVIIEANEAPVIPLLQEIARQTNRKIIISDEAHIKSKGHKYVTYRPLDFTLDRVLESFSETSLSWGKVGPDTYLVVPRQESSTEIAARKAELDKFIQSSREHIENQRKQELKQEPKREPHQEPFNGRFWLLTPDRKEQAEKK